MFPVDLRHEILNHLSLNELWRISHCEDRGIRLTFFGPTRRSMKSRLRKYDLSDDQWLKKYHDPWTGYIITLFQCLQAHREMDLFDMDSPIVNVLRVNFVGPEPIIRMALQTANHVLYGFLLDYLPFPKHYPQLILEGVKVRSEIIHSQINIRLNEFPSGYLHGFNGEDLDSVEDGYLFGLLKGQHLEILRKRLPSTPDWFQWIIRENPRIAETIVPSTNQYLIPLTVWSIKWRQVDVLKRTLSKVSLTELDKDPLLKEMPLTWDMATILESYGFKLVDTPKKPFELSKFLLFFGAIVHREIHQYMEVVKWRIPDDYIYEKSLWKILVKAPIYYLKVFWQVQRSQSVLDFLGMYCIRKMDFYRYEIYRAWGAEPDYHELMKYRSWAKYRIERYPHLKADLEKLDQWTN